MSSHIQSHTAVFLLAQENVCKCNISEPHTSQVSPCSGFTLTRSEEHSHHHTLRPLTLLEEHKKEQDEVTLNEEVNTLPVFMFKKSHLQVNSCPERLQ